MAHRNCKGDCTQEESLRPFMRRESSTAAAQRVLLELLPDPYVVDLGRRRQRRPRRIERVVGDSQLLREDDDERAVERLWLDQRRRGIPGIGQAGLAVVDDLDRRWGPLNRV